MRFVRPLCLAAATLGSLFTVAACASKNETQPPPQQPPAPYYGYGTPPPGQPYPANPGQPYPTTGAPAPGPGAPMGAPPPTAGATPGAAPGGFPFPIPSGFPSFPGAAPAGGGGGGATSGPQAQAIDPNFAVAATGALNLVAASETAGMQKEGAPLAGNFQEGQVLEQQITIAPGKCYTFVAAGVGVQELELTLVPLSPVPGLPSVGNMGSAKGSGSKTALGGGGNCIKLALVPFPVQAKWILKASRGGGLAAGQAFVK